MVHLRFKAAVCRQLNQDVQHGRMSKEEARKLRRGLTDYNVEHLLNEVSRGSEYPMLDKIWKFVQDNWLDILKALVVLVSLVGDGHDDE